MHDMQTDWGLHARLAALSVRVADCASEAQLLETFSITSHFHSAVQKECLVFFSSFPHSS